MNSGIPEQIKQAVVKVAQQINAENKSWLVDYATIKAEDIERRILTALAPHFTQRGDPRGELAVAWDSSSRNTAVLISRANGGVCTVIYEGRGKDGFWREGHDAARLNTEIKTK